MTRYDVEDEKSVRLVLAKSKVIEAANRGEMTAYLEGEDYGILEAAIPGPRPSGPYALTCYGIIVRLASEWN